MTSDKTIVTGVSGDGAVRIRLTRNGSVASVEIAELLLTPKDKEMAEGLIAAAIEDALTRLTDHHPFTK